MADTDDTDPTARLGPNSEGRAPAGRSPHPPAEDPPQLIDDRLIELVFKAAKLLVIVVYTGALVTFGMLTLGFFLFLFGASPEAPFVDWIYRSTGQAMKPFRGMFPIREIDGRSVFDPSLLFAAALYGFLAIGLHAVVDYLTSWARLHHRRAERVSPSSGPTSDGGTP